MAGVCMQETRPPKRAVRNLLECILVNKINQTSANRHTQKCRLTLRKQDLTKTNQNFILL